MHHLGEALVQRGDGLGRLVAAGGHAGAEALGRHDLAGAVVDQLGEDIDLGGSLRPPEASIWKARSSVERLYSPELLLTALTAPEFWKVSIMRACTSRGSRSLQAMPL